MKNNCVIAVLLVVFLSQSAFASVRCDKIFKLETKSVSTLRSDVRRLVYSPLTLALIAQMDASLRTYSDETIGLNIYTLSRADIQVLAERLYLELGEFTTNSDSSFREINKTKFTVMFDSVAKTEVVQEIEILIAGLQANHKELKVNKIDSFDIIPIGTAFEVSDVGVKLGGAMVETAFAVQLGLVGIAILDPSYLSYSQYPLILSILGLGTMVLAPTAMGSARLLDKIQAPITAKIRNYWQSYSIGRFRSAAQQQLNALPASLHFSQIENFLGPKPLIENKQFLRTRSGMPPLL